MTDEIDALLKRQARWQKSLKDLSWSEKVRLAEAIRESVVRLRMTCDRETSEEQMGSVPTRR